MTDYSSRAGELIGEMLKSVTESIRQADESKAYRATYDHIYWMGDDQFFQASPTPWVVPPCKQCGKPTSEHSFERTKGNYGQHVYLKCPEPPEEEVFISELDGLERAYMLIPTAPGCAVRIVYRTFHFEANTEEGAHLVMERTLDTVRAKLRATVSHGDRIIWWRVRPKIMPFEHPKVYPNGKWSARCRLATSPDLTDKDWADCFAKAEGSLPTRVYY